MVAGDVARDDVPSGIPLGKTRDAIPSGIPLGKSNQPFRPSTPRGPVINHGNAGNQTKGPASATISKESGGLPHGKPREAPRKLRKIPRKFREFWWNFGVSSSVRRALFQARLVM